MKVHFNKPVTIRGRVIGYSSSDDDKTKLSIDIKRRVVVLERDGLANWVPFENVVLIEGIE